MDGGVRGADNVDLREGTKGALAGDAYLVASLVDALDSAFHRESGLECAFQPALRGGIADTFAGQDDSAFGRDHDGLKAIADRDIDIAVRVFQFGNVNLRLALPTDADAGHLRPDRHNGPLDGLALRDSTRLDGRRLEHRGEIFFLLAHCPSI